MLDLITFQLKTNKKQILGWSIAIFSVCFLYMILFPSIQTMANIKMEAMPKELLKFVGIENMNDLSNYTTYFGMVYQFVLIAISIFAAVFSASIFSKEEKTRTIEFLYSLKVSRLEIYFSKIITSICALMCVIISGAIAVITCGFIVGSDTFNFMDIVQILKFSSITTFIFFSLGSLSSAFSSKISGGMIASIVLLFSYTLGYLSSIVSESLSWLKYFSPFTLFSANNVLNINNQTIITLLIYFVIIVVFLTLGAFVYKKRDFKI